MPMPNTRELILERLLAISLALPNSKGAFRNRGLLSTDKRPCIAILDGDERASLPMRKSSRGAAIVTPMLMEMTPEIFLTMPEMRPTNADSAHDIGGDLNAFRIALSAAIVGDSALKALMGSNGSIALTGYTTDLKSGSAAAGQMRLDFAFTYLFDPR